MATKDFLPLSDRLNDDCYFLAKCVRIPLSMLSNAFFMAFNVEIFMTRKLDFIYRKLK